MLIAQPLSGSFSASMVSVAARWKMLSGPLPMASRSSESSRRSPTSARTRMPGAAGGSNGARSTSTSSSRAAGRPSAPARRPPAIIARTSARPMKPLAPVTRTFMHSACLDDDRPGGVGRDLSRHGVGGERGAIPQREVEACPGAALGLGPDTTAVATDDALDRREADARALELARRMQAAEHLEELARHLHVEAGPVVGHPIDGDALDELAVEHDVGLLAARGVLPGIAQQVLEHDAKQDTVAPALHPANDLEAHPSLGIELAQLVEHAVGDGAQVHRLGRHGLGRDARP